MSDIATYGREVLVHSMLLCVPLCAYDD